MVSHLPVGGFFEKVFFFQDVLCFLLFCFQKEKEVYNTLGFQTKFGFDGLKPRQKPTSCPEKDSKQLDGGLCPEGSLRYIPRPFNYRSSKLKKNYSKTIISKSTPSWSVLV